MNSEELCDECGCGLIYTTGVGYVCPECGRVVEVED
jgi:predicted RNA-binding Zn-ribbon protein involved in translation (DUF1610 family)